MVHSKKSRSKYKHLESWKKDLYLFNRYGKNHLEYVPLSNENFKYGTYIIKKSGYYQLTEDILFNPNNLEQMQTEGIPGLVPPNPNFVPYDAGIGEPHPAQFGLFHTQPTNILGYSPAAYGIGFFAAIAIQTKGVILDLNGHKIEQSIKHAIQQKFYAHIEMADQPFIPTQGPHDFGSVLSSAQKTIVKNGTLGISSHHGIHGNGGNDIYITKLHIQKYEVAGIALNGVKNVIISHCCMSGQNTEIPIFAIYSSARFIRPYVNQLGVQALTLKVGGIDKSSADIQHELKKAINTVYQGIVNNEPWWNDTNQMIINQFGEQVNPGEYYRLFANVPGLIDGNCYGLLLNGLGIAVEGFPTELSDTPAENIDLSYITVKNVHGKIKEIPALNNGSGGAQIDAVGAVFQTQNKYNNTYLTLNNQKRYIGNVIANAKVLLGKYKGNISQLDVSRVSITQDTINWVESFTKLDDTNLSYVCNGDGMFHVNKGVIGYKLDSVKHLIVKHCALENAINEGELGSELCGDYTKSHPAQSLKFSISR